jgi:hypothetical protein
MSLFNLGTTNMSGALGSAPTGLFSGLDPSASAGAYGGNPLGGGIAGQVAGNTPISSGASGGMGQAMQMMLIQQAVNSASQLGQQAPIQANNFAQYANPQAQVTPAMLGAMMNRSA